jgi:hypothetical protein
LKVYAATDDPLHGHQKGRFFHVYYDCYCYLPLYIFCWWHLLAAKLRRSNIDASAEAVAEVARIVSQQENRTSDPGRLPQLPGDEHHRLSAQWWPPRVRAKDGGA